MPSITIEYIHYLIPVLSSNTLLILQRDITEEIESFSRIGREICKKAEWQKLARDINAEYTKRVET